MGISLRLLAHASVQIQTESQNIYLDPSTKGTGLKKAQFSPADLILITHGHQDHFDKDLVKKIRKGGSPIIAPVGLKKEIGGGVVWEMSAGERMVMNDGIEIVTTPAYNVKRFRSPGQPFHPQGLGVGYIIKVNDRRIYHAGDTDLIPEMERVSEVDVALLASGGTYTMDCAEAAEAAILIKPKVVIPIHLRGADPQGFKQEVESKSSTKVVILKGGESYEIE